MICTACGQQVEPGDLECSLCGRELPAARAAPGQAAQAVASSPSAGSRSLPPPQPLYVPGEGSGRSFVAPRGPGRVGLVVAAVAVVATVVVVAAALLVAVRLRSSGSGAGSGPSSGGTAGSSTATSSTATEPSTIGPGSADGAVLSSLHRLDRVARISVPGTSAPASDAAGRQIAYDAAHLVDGDLATAWRMDGDGSGQTLELTFTEPTALRAVGLVNGYAKIDPSDGTDRYPQMRRIAKITWRFDGQAAVSEELVDGDRTSQLIVVPEVTVRTVTATIDQTVPPGDPALDYTPISELYLLGR